jgi:hypothetical protein
MRARVSFLKYSWRVVSRVFLQSHWRIGTYKELLTGPVGALCRHLSAMGFLECAIESQCIP